MGGCCRSFDKPPATSYYSMFGEAEVKGFDPVFYRISRFRVPRMSTFVRPAAEWSTGILVWDTSRPLELRLTFGLYDLFGKSIKTLNVQVI